MRFCRCWLQACVLGIFVAISATSGCIPFAYVYPKIDYIPEVTLANVEDPVYVFEVDSTEWIHGFIMARLTTREHIRFAGKADNRMLPEQRQVFINRGAAGLGLVRFASRDMFRRLYRPGFKMVELKKKDDTLIWQKATTLESRIAALDEIWSGDRVKLPGEKYTTNYRFRHYAKFDEPARHFLLAEYERLVRELEQTIQIQPTEPNKNLLDHIRQTIDRLQKNQFLDPVD